jgi:hypothetical protein
LHCFFQFAAVFHYLFPQAAALDAASTTTRIDLPDGGYIIEEISSNTPTTRATTSTSKTKTHTRYTSKGHPLYAISVTGSFKYTGSTSWATGSSATVAIYDSDVVFVSKSTSYASNYATATGRIKYLGDSESHTVTLYCDKNGNFS